MPTTRRSSRSSTGASGKQSTLSFKHKVTKAIRTGKEEYKSPSRTKEYIPKPSPEPASSKDTKQNAGGDDDDDASQVQTPTTSASTDDEQKQQQHDRPLRQIEQQAQPALAQVKSEDELKAEEITDRAIERYWAGIEAGRMAKAVHKKHGEGLSTGEKVLRYFDVSSQYGPCIGIARIKRWQRAQRLGLNPPIEVLAVLLKEEARGNSGIETAHMDELLNSTAVGSVGV
ncbi:hypothetical protein N657DRAFT_648715 [Parathielavia appendiculata]|uniref:DNA polymerase delta subunit 4 n=1 Tax=Parathielavia appendiculata TaxID=2587402 RepID=A0AAN6TUV5_9PEZI|nr:hypothetical protein N657DRAFT_648715 [Parathielavia appendiculata]